MADYHEDWDNIVNTAETDEVGTVTVKLNHKLDTKYNIFTPDGTVRSEAWKELVQILRTFMESNSEAWGYMEELMTAYGDENVLTDDCNRFGINRLLLESWIRAAWDMGSSTTLRDVKSVMEAWPVVPEYSLVKKYSDNLARTQALLGQEFNVTKEVTQADDGEWIRATVDLTHVISNLQMVAQLFEFRPTLLNRVDLARAISGWLCMLNWLLNWIDNNYIC